MTTSQLLLAFGATLITLGLVAGILFDGWPEVLAIQTIALALGAWLHGQRGGRR
jgi:hypothetical protein